MRIDVITILPELMESPLNNSILKRAKDKNIFEIKFHNPRDYCKDRKRPDDYPYGGSAGMVLKLEPIYEIITKLKKEREYDEIIFLTPDGKTLEQGSVNHLSCLKNIIIICGHYKGIDHRIREYLVTKEISIGDYVLTGGEIAATILIDAIVRVIPGAIGDMESALSDSFQDGLLSCPVYSRPAEFNGWKVPEVLLNGNFKEIDKWQTAQSLERTKILRPDLFSLLKDDDRK